MIMALNQVDFAAKKGIEIDVNGLSRRLGIPVVPTVAINGIGIRELLSTVVHVIERKEALQMTTIQYGKEIEENLLKLEKVVEQKLCEIVSKYPSRWIAIKLLEKDEDISEKVGTARNGREVLKVAEGIVNQIEKLHGEPSSVVMASERYGIASRISKDVTRLFSPPRITFKDRLSALTAHRILGYPILAAIIAVMFSIIFVVGDFFVDILGKTFDIMLIPAARTTLLGNLNPTMVDLITGGLLSGISAGITIALPYIVPFYILLGFLEDSGYLPRAAFLMDNIMHKIGLHGKAFIPVLLGYGCNVPACVGCRILETDRERFLAGFVVVLLPCAATTVVILGLVGRYVGLPTAFALYVFDLILIFALGRVAFKVLPGEPVGLIMEIPPYRIPSLTSVAKKTWGRTKDFVLGAFPLIIAGSLIMQLLITSDVMGSIVGLMAPLVEDWLGLPSFTGIPLIFGILRKELTLILLAERAGTSLNQALTPVQMIVFGLVTMIYVPCISTIAALGREFGWKRATAVSVLDTLLALIVGGVAYRLLLLFVR